MLNAPECRREAEAKAEALRATAAATHLAAAHWQNAARQNAPAPGALGTMVPVFKTLILALALVSSIVVVFYFGATASFSISAAHMQTASANVAEPRATFMFSTDGTKGSAAAQLPVPSRPRHMYARNPCMCCFRACSRRWTVPLSATLRWRDGNPRSGSGLPIQRSPLFSVR